MAYDGEDLQAPEDAVQSVSSKVVRISIIISWNDALQLIVVQMQIWR